MVQAAWVMQEGEEEAAATEEGRGAYGGRIRGAVKHGGFASQGTGHSCGNAYPTQPPEQINVYDRCLCDAESVCFQFLGTRQDKC